ncbi:MAG TPA: hypothetical protein VKT77_12110 [Chthonomonadaceae bacterium]|nr:hypothetical protein [Chthonomonadaceae bacterium]
MPSDRPTELAGEPAGAYRAIAAAAACVALLAITLRLYLIFSTHATEEDFYITLRYAENLAHGAGLVFNPGEHVLGTTTPLYTLLLAAAVRGRLDPVLFGKLLAAAADAGSCMFAWRMGRALGRPIAGLCAAVVLAAAPLNLTVSVKGMESSLTACACIGAWSLWAEQRTTGAWICAGLAVLLRIDATLLTVILLAACVLRDRRPPWTGLAVFAVMTAPWLLYASLTFGSPVPTSLRAKLIVYGWHSASRFPNLVPFLHEMAHSPLGILLAVGALAAVLGVAAASRDHPLAPSHPHALLLAPLLAWLAVYYGGMAFSKVFLFGWYYLPPTPAYYLAACVGWAWLAEAAVRRFGRRPIVVRSASGAAAACVAAAGLLALFTVPRVARTLRDSQRVEEELRIPIGLWLKAHAAPGDTVMLEPIGYIGYFSGLRVLDTVGLVSPQVLPFYRQAEASPYHAIWQRFRPQWVLLRAGEWSDLRRYESTLRPGEWLEADYRLARTWRSPGDRPDAPPSFLLFHRIDGPAE